MEIAASAGDREHARPEAPSGLIQARVWRCTRPVHNVLLHLSENCISPMSHFISNKGKCVFIGAFVFEKMYNTFIQDWKDHVKLSF